MSKRIVQVVIASGILTASAVFFILASSSVSAYVTGCNTGHNQTGWWASCNYSSSGKVKAMVQCVNIFNANGYMKYGPSVRTGQASVITSCGWGEHVYNNNVYAREG